jgi:CRP-like cAMP-binding protein
MDLSVFLRSIYPLDDELINELTAHFKWHELPKSYSILKPGQTCENLWFLLNGAARYYYIDEKGRERNVWFSIDSDVIADTPSFLFQTPSSCAIQLIEDSEIIAISKSSIDFLLKKHHAFALWYLKVFENFYIHQVEDRITDLQFLSAGQRYEKLLAQHPSIIQRISLGHISSYLNITQETLSRIRAEKSCN